MKLFWYNFIIIFRRDPVSNNNLLYFCLSAETVSNLGGLMTIVDMLEQSGVLTLLGMGVVFAFLIIMVICVTLVGKFIHAIGADKDVIQQAQPASPAGAAKATAVAAAITAAVSEYQKSNT
jgi:oxaloacetate decarboxylase gamma subunit